MLRNILRNILNYFPKLRISPRCLRIRRASIQNCICNAVSFHGIVYAQDYAQDYPSQDNVEIQKAILEWEKYVAQKLGNIRLLIIQTIVEYKECLIQLIEITKENTLIGRVSENWDELVTFKIKADELKNDLTMLESLATNMEDSIVKEHALGNYLVFNHINCEFMKLRKLCKLFLAEMRIYETELLEVTRDCILYATVDDEVD